MATSIGLRINDPKFFDAADLRAEVDRVFEICNGCRLCIKFCDSFPTIFNGIDKITEQRREAHLKAHPELLEQARARRAQAQAAGETAPDGVESAEVMGDELPELSAHAADLPDHLRDKALDECFQCKLCYPNCPYTPPHDFAVDFPRLLLRMKAQRVRRRGVSLAKKLLRNPDFIGRLSSKLPRLMNWANRNSLNRAIMEMILGVHRDKLLPIFHKETFPRWWKQHRPEVKPPQPLKEGLDPAKAMPLKVALFSTCLINWNDPEAGKAAVRVLEHNGVEVVWPQQQVCCGMPFLDEGDIDAAQVNIRRNAGVLLEWVNKGYAVVIPSPSCSLMIREEYEQILGTEDARRLAANSYDLGDYIFKLKREGRIKRDFKLRYEKIKYHLPCHMKTQNIGFRGRDMLDLCTDVVEVNDHCSGHDGTWSMMKATHDRSMHWGKKLFDGMKPSAGEPCSGACGECHLAATQVQEATGVKMTHPVVALAKAYGFDVGKQGDRLEGNPVA